jgi:hypothetical protein
VRDTPQWKTQERLLAFKQKNKRWPVEKDADAAELHRFRARLCRILRGEGNIDAWPSQLLSEARRAKVLEDNPRRAGPPLPVKGRQADMLARLESGQQLSQQEVQRLQYSYNNGNLSENTAKVFAQYGVQLAA